MAIVENGEWNCTAEEYHAAFDYQSRSMLEVFRRSPRRYKAMFIDKTLPPEPPTPEMLTGTLSHLCVLEPERLKTDVVVIPESVLAKNGAKSTNAYRDFAAEHAGKLLVKQDELDRCQAIVDQCWRDGIAKKFLSAAGPTEHTIVWQDDETGLMCRARRDKVLPFAILDIKTTTDSDEESFRRTCIRFGLQRQAAFYLDGHAAVTGEKLRFGFIAVSTEPPFDVDCYELGPDELDLGRRQNRRTMFALARAFEYDDWNRPQQKKMRPLKYPPYALRDEQEITDE